MSSVLKSSSHIYQNYIVLKYYLSKSESHPRLIQWDQTLKQQYFQM